MDNWTDPQTGRAAVIVILALLGMIIVSLALIVAYAVTLGYGI